MELITFECSRGHYSGYEDITLSVPKGEKFIYRDGSVGDGVHTGYNHYMMVLRKSQYNKTDIDTINDNNKWTSIFDWNEFYIIAIRDIKFKIEPPVYESYKEVMDEYKFNEYYIVRKKEDYWEKETIDQIIDGKLEIQEAMTKFVEGPIYQVGKILRVEGPFDFTTFEVHVGNYFNDTPMYGMDIISNLSIWDLNPEKRAYSSRKEDIILTKDPTYFEQLKNEILSKTDNY